MSKRTLQLDETIHRYLLDALPPEDPVDTALREETARRPDSGMQIAPEQAALLAFLIRSLCARRVLEIGVYTGYSTLAMARALPRDGEVVALDRDAGVTAIARRYWQQAGVDRRIDLRIGPALDSLAVLEREVGHGHFDFAFLDADKREYRDYFAYCLRLVRPGGVIAVDNVLWSGRVADPGEDDEDTRALRAFNAGLRGDNRVDYTMIPIADGVTLARVRPERAEEH